MNALDYYNNPAIVGRIDGLTRRMSNAEDKEDCRQEIFAELYDFMPLDTPEALLIIERVARKFKRHAKEIELHEEPLSDYA